MQTYIAILRGINVSGHKLIKMEELVALFKSLGLENVNSYIQSGNVVFRCESTNAKDLEKQIAKKIYEKYGFEVPVLVKEKEELAKVLKNNPFVNKRNEDVTKLHVTFLSHEPDPPNINKIKQQQFEPDEFFVLGSTIYLYCPNGYGNTKLNNIFFENKLKVVATTRNWKTINELVSMAETP